MPATSFAPLLKARAAFDRALAQPKDEFTRDASIQRFEFCLELSWKSLRRVLKQRGADETFPADVFRTAARGGLIDDAEPWLEFLRLRNLTSHTYNEDLAEALYAALPRFQVELGRLVDHLVGETE
jgi:nucleotidyltransferase substrate binding protein (TIGR01987 family)